MNNKKAHIIIKGIGWAQSYGTNWCYRYYDVTIISDNLDLLKLQGVYVDTFGSVTNYFSTLREIKDINVIVDEHLSEVKQSINRMKKMTVGTELKAICDILAQ